LIEDHVIGARQHDDNLTRERSVLVRKVAIRQARRSNILKNPLVEAFLANSIMPAQMRPQAQI
jgi:hypothetical protein